MFHATIAGTGRAIPERILTNDDLAKMVETSDEWITSARESVNAAWPAGRHPLGLLRTRGDPRSPRRRDLGGRSRTVILSTCTPDHLIPGAAPVVQFKLGAKKACAFDLNAACSGWLYGLHVADGLIQSGKAKNVLLLGAEFLTRFVDYTDRGTCILFGDGAGATVLKATKADHSVLSTSIHSDGEGAPFIAMPGGGSTYPPNVPKRSRRGFRSSR